MKALSDCIRENASGPQNERHTDITATETPGPTPVAALPGVMVDLAGLLG